MSYNDWLDLLAQHHNLPLQNKKNQKQNKDQNVKTQVTKFEVKNNTLICWVQSHDFQWQEDEVIYTG